LMMFSSMKVSTTNKDLYLYLLLLFSLLSACEDTDQNSSSSNTMTREDMGMITLAGMEAGNAQAGAMGGGTEITGGVIGDNRMDMDNSWSQDMMTNMMSGVMAGNDSRDMMPPPALCISGPLPSSQVNLDLSPRCRIGNQALKIHDIRNPACPDYRMVPDHRPGLDINLSSVVVTGIFGDDKFSVQDTEGGSFSGLWVYNSQRRDISSLQVGSLVNLRGQLIEFFTLSELIIEADGLEIIGSAPLPDPVVITETNKIADQGMWAEALESVLITVDQAEVTNTAPDCPREFGMFVVNDDLRMSPEYEIDDPVARGDIIESVTGVLHYSFEHHKLLIPSVNNINLVACGGVPDKCEATDCPVVIDANESNRLIITEIQNNPQREDDDREYVEIYNPSANPIDLSEWRLQDCAGHTAMLTGNIGARTHYVVAGSSDQDLNGGLRAQSLLGDLFLPNGYGSVLLFDQEGTLVDQVRYEPGNDEWPDRDVGESLELVEPAADNREGSSWAAGNNRYGDGGKGSPGEAYQD
jgi:hypothetical protein